MFARVWGKTNLPCDHDWRAVLQDVYSKITHGLVLQHLGYGKMMNAFKVNAKKATHSLICQDHGFLR